MVQHNLEQVINTLKIQLLGIRHMEVAHPITVTGHEHVKNRLLIVHKGQITLTYQRQEIILSVNDVYFIPAGRSVNITYGKKSSLKVKKNEINEKFLDSYLQPVDLAESFLHSDLFSIVEFDVQAYNTIDFFNFIEIPALKIEANSQMNTLIKGMLEEDQSERLGKEHLLNSAMMIFIILLIRYMVSQKFFLQNIRLKLGALMDVRLVKLFTYIISNLDKNLSNDSLAQQVGLNRDYIGQFFKKYTRLNLQEYVRSVRIQRAIVLLSTTGKPIASILAELGFKDFAYFCRLFKRSVGLTAMQVRKEAKKGNFSPN